MNNAPSIWIFNSAPLWHCELESKWETQVRRYFTFYVLTVSIVLCLHTRELAHANLILYDACAFKRVIGSQGGEERERGIETDERGRIIERQWGEGKQKGGDGNGLKINRQKCFFKSAAMQSIHSNRRSCSVTTAPFHMVLHRTLWLRCDTYTCNFPANDTLFLVIYDVVVE